MFTFVHVSFPNGTVYLPRGTVILYVNHAGSAVLLGNLYTVYEGHAFCTFGVYLVTYLIREGFVGAFGEREKSFLPEIQIEKY